MSDYDQFAYESFVDGTANPATTRWIWWVNQLDHSQRVQAVALYDDVAAGEGIEISDVAGRVVFIKKDNIQYLESALAAAKTEMGL